MPGVNPRSTTFRDSPEEQWLQAVKRDLGDDFAQRILRFERMEPEDFRVFNERLKKFVQEHREVNTSRMRKVYEVIRNATTISELLLGLPKLAYMVGKEERRGAKEHLGVLYMVFSQSIAQAREEKDLQGIRKFAEALVAYHKFYAENRNQG
ncbi:MAG: type III-A CRISPR-associated protein Csm2 [Candidatus Caldatribacteriaceae bacterium]